VYTLLNVTNNLKSNIIPQGNVIKDLLLFIETLIKILLSNRLGK